MSEDRLPAAFDRTSLIGTEPYRAGSLGPRSPWSSERGDRRGFLPTPDPEAAGPGRQQIGWKVRIELLIKQLLILAYVQPTYFDVKVFFLQLTRTQPYRAAKSRLVT
jgi:hypothetical protein